MSDSRACALKLWAIYVLSCETDLRHRPLFLPSRKLSPKRETRLEMLHTTSLNFCLGSNSVMFCQLVGKHLPLCDNGRI